MEPYLELSTAPKAEESSVRDPNKEILRVIEEIRRVRQEKTARDEVINSSNNGDTKIEDYNAEEMNIIANEKMFRRRRERFMRQLRLRRKKKKSKSSQDEESFLSDSDEEMKIAQEEVKRLMEKAIRDNLTSTINTNDGDEAKIVDSKAEDEKMFPRRRGRFIRYLRRQRSKSQDSAFEIELHHLHLPMAEEPFMSYSDERD